MTKANFLLVLPFLFALVVSGPAAAQDYPARPIRALTAVSAGGTSDIFMRAMAREVGKRFNQTIVVEDRRPNECRRRSLRAGGARRLLHLHPAAGNARL
jgi:hypothetical protein